MSFIIILIKKLTIKNCFCKDYKKCLETFYIELSYKYHCKENEGRTLLVKYTCDSLKSSVSLKVTNMFMLQIVVVFIWLYTFPQTYHLVYIKHMQLLVCKKLKCSDTDYFSYYFSYFYI